MEFGGRSHLRLFAGKTNMVMFPAIRSPLSVDDSILPVLPMDDDGYSNVSMSFNIHHFYCASDNSH